MGKGFSWAKDVAFKIVTVTYLTKVDKCPMAVRCVETFLSCGTCDIVAQTLIENHGWSDLDLTRSFKFAAIGFCWTGPMMTLWYPRYYCGTD